MAVRTATAEILCEQGYAGTTIDAIAKRSGVARTTIYRHWPSLAALVHEVAIETIADHDEPDSGDTKQDLRDLVGHISEKLDRELGRLLPTIVDAAERDAEMRELQVAYVADRRHAGGLIIERGIERGDIDPAAPIDVVLEQLIAPLFFRRLVSRAPITSEYLDQLVDGAWRLIQHPAARQGR